MAYIKVLLALFIIGSASVAHAQLNVSDGYTAAQLANKLVGAGVTVSGAVLTCPTVASGEFTVVSSNLGIDCGVVLTSGAVVTGGTTFGVNITNGLPAFYAPDSLGTNFASTDNGAAGDADLTNLAGQPTNDACVLEFDFIPAGDTIRFNYVFGSEEYRNFTCSQFNDVFGFLISGPGFSGPTNIALVPGTNIPVCINSVNIGHATGGWDIADCNSIGPGSPFPAYFVNNATGTSVMYDGFTTVLTAKAGVTPCATYHLKLGVADAFDWNYDSGVFLEAGSLTSVPAATLVAGGVGTLPYAIRGCAPGHVTFTTATTSCTPTVIKYQISGSAINGTDYATIGDSVIIPPFGTSATVNIDPLLLPPAGPKTVILTVLVADHCDPTLLVPNPSETATLTIYDSFHVSILTSDTLICNGKHVDIVVQADPAFGSIMTYNWVPAAYLNNATILNPTATPPAAPTATTITYYTYTIHGNVAAAAGCPDAIDQITIGVFPPAHLPTVVDTICVGQTYMHDVTMPAGVTYTYLWAGTPAIGINNDTLANAVFTPSVSASYVLIAEITPLTANCAIMDTVFLRVLPNVITVHPVDTSICQGGVVQMFGDGDPAFTYQWIPTAGIGLSTVLNAFITPDTSALYTVTAHFHSCPDIHATSDIHVQPQPSIYLGGNRVLCEFDTLHVHASVSPAWYSGYTYSWTPATDLDNSTTSTVVFSGTVTTNLHATVTSSAGCTAQDSALVTVINGNFAGALPDLTFCPHDSAILNPAGGAGYSYHWYPSAYLSDSLSNSPVVRPLATTTYHAVVTNGNGCSDTVYFNAVVFPGALVSLGDDTVMLYPGDSYTMSPATNCTSFTWFPYAGVSNPYISNPTVNPDFSTRYFVTGYTENGCKAVDSIDVNVSTESVVSLPNAFTPGTGSNPEFKIIKLGIANLNYFRIFNRWGNIVFETKDINEGWDGTWKGEPQPFGVYVYSIQGVTPTGKVFNKTGNVTVIR